MGTKNGEELVIARAERKKASLVAPVAKEDDYCYDYSSFQKE